MRTKLWIHLNISIALLVTLAALAACREDSKMEEDGKDSFHYQRQEMVRRQLKGRDIRDELVLAAMAKVPRHQFVPHRYRADSYIDGPLPIGYEQTISQPYIVALMTQLAQIDSTSIVLEIGTGSGYQAAVLAEIAANVYTIEIVEPLCERAESILAAQGYTNIAVRCGDGYRGWLEHAPFDAVIVTAAPDHIPQPLIDQLAVGGRLVIPVGNRDQELMLVVKSDTGTVTKTVIPVRFVPMTGEAEER